MCRSDEIKAIMNYYIMNLVMQKNTKLFYCIQDRKKVFNEVIKSRYMTLLSREK